MGSRNKSKRRTINTGNINNNVKNELRGLRRWIGKQPRPCDTCAVVKEIDRRLGEGRR